jgi:RNA polymerase sigma-70 factor (ECF subfamily)
VASNELEYRIKIAMEELPEQCRMVFKLSRFEELKYAEIADQLNISIKTVENHMGKALKIMREQLKDYLPLIIVLLNGFLN